MAPTAETITAAMQQIEPKKEELKKAFDELQSYSDVFSLFSLSWSDLDSHFTSLHNSLSQKLHLLQTLESQQPSSSNSQTQIEKDPTLPTQITKEATLPTRNRVKVNYSDEWELVPPRPELVGFCEKMDVVGLRKYMNETKRNRDMIRAELFGALQRAPDPALMVLNAMEGFYVENKGDKDVEVSNVRRTSVVLLEVLCGVSPNVGEEVRERARKLALEWKGKVSLEGENQFESMGLLHLVSAFGLVSEFSVDELVDHMVVVARYRQATGLFRRLGLGDKVTDLIQKLMSKGKHLFAIKFISEFDMTDMFPPVPILKAYVKESKRLAKKISEEGNNSKRAANEAIAKESGALKSVVKIIEDLKLESEYPPSSLERRIDQLEKEKANRKRQAAAPGGKPFQLQQQYGNKRPRITAPVGSTAVSASAAGLLVKSPTAYMSSAAAPYVVSGTAPPVAPYVGSSTSTHLYSSNQYAPSGHYHNLTVYGGYGVPPQYHPSYHSQQ
ncbi:truncated FRIGIDA-like protein 1 [Argentina anserina]|uniref:truncated FRIGIDA-like protein 1 n=1 Tax=Argentina anserina TaxID=57926 RepID=UPI00217658BA|nr:truncated FRIGIDA-like protein 1 [Potentilla anserina]